MTKEELEILARASAKRHNLSGQLICGLVERESNWDPFAIRSESESGFMRRYGAAYNRIVRASATKVDDHWIKWEDLFYTSYGLMQTMYPVIIETFPEVTAKLKYPTYLCDPELSLELGCRLFAKKLQQSVGDTARALLRWNGGGDPQYPDKVFAAMKNYDKD